MSNIPIASPMLISVLTAALFVVPSPGPLGATTDHGDSCLSAARLGPEAEILGHHDYREDFDYFAVEIPSPGLLRLRLSGNSAREPRMQLLGRDCDGLASDETRLLASSDVERVLMVRQSGTYFLRVRGREAGDRFRLRSDFAAARREPHAVFEPLGDAADECPGGIGGDGSTTPDEEEDDVMIVQGGVPFPFGGGDGSTTPDEEEDDVMIVQGGMPFPFGDGAIAGLPPLAAGVFYRLGGEVDAEDVDVLTLRIQTAGWLSIESAGADLRGSLYAGAGCDSRTQIRSDVELRRDGPLGGLLAAVEPGVYRLRLAPGAGAGGRYELAIRVLPSPGA